MGATKRILIVDDEALLVEMICERLRFLGYEAESAENGAEALSKLESTPFNLVIMDAMMPVMDGLQATRLIKGHEKLKKIPVVFLSARARKEDENEARKAGADDYVVKPFEMNVLGAVIEKWLKK